MSKPSMEVRETEPMHWAQICTALYMCGFMETHSKAECLQMAEKIKKRVASGHVRKVRRGVYQPIYSK